MESFRTGHIGEALAYSIYFPVVAVVGYALYIVLRAVLDPLRCIPGPFQARLSRLWYLKHINNGKQEITENELHKQYGPIVRLAPGWYSFSDIEATKVIYDIGSKFPKSDFYKPFGAPESKSHNIFQEQDPIVHAHMKRKIASIYSLSSIVSYEPFVDREIETYFSKLDQFVISQTTFDLPSWMQYYAFDVIGAITIGDPYGFMEHGSDFPGIIHELHAGQSFACHLGTFAGSFYPTFVSIMSRFVTDPPFKNLTGYTAASLAKKNKALEDGKITGEILGKQDFAEKLLSMKAQGKIEDHEVIATIRGNIAAGSDTTGITLSMTMYHLLRNPQILAKLREEVDTHKSTHSEPITYTQATGMPYLQAIIKESLRLSPAIGMQLPRVVPPNGATISGHFFPGGTIVGVNPCVIHRQPELFGADADNFRPERWLESSEKSKELDRYLFTFGAGSRTCLGKHISMLEIQKLLPELVAKYDIELVDGNIRKKNRFFVYANYDCRVKMRS